MLHVWKRVEKYAKDGFTAVIHGKYTHEESRATASQVNKHEGGKYIIVRNMEEGELLFDYIAKRPGHLTRQAFIEHFAHKASDGFDPDVHLEHIGVANQTTMLANESLAIGWKVHEAMVEHFGDEHASTHFRSFGTICSATQERQDAVTEMMQEPPDIMLVIGGYNSSNTNHLAHLCRQHTTTFHVEDAKCIDVDVGTTFCCFGGDGGDPRAAVCGVFGTPVHSARGAPTAARAARTACRRIIVLFTSDAAQLGTYRSGCSGSAAARTTRQKRGAGRPKIGAWRTVSIRCVVERGVARARPCKS